MLARPLLDKTMHARGTAVTRSSVLMMCLVKLEAQQREACLPLLRARMNGLTNPAECVAAGHACRVSSIPGGGLVPCKLNVSRVHVRRTWCAQYYISDYM